MDYSQQNGAWFNGQQMNSMGQPMFPGQDMSGWGYGPMQGGWDNGYSGMMGTLPSSLCMPSRIDLADSSRIQSDDESDGHGTVGIWRW